MKDEGTEVFSTFEDGEIVEEVKVDSRDLYAWDSRTTLYEDGEAVSMTTVFDDGSEDIVTYADLMG